MLLRRRRLLTLGSGALAAALVAMGGAVPASAATAAPVTLTIGLLQDLSSPNVTVGYLVPDFEVWNMQYATLTSRAADDFDTIPGLAESWETSDDGRTVTYRLRDGLRWSDGEALTADDIVYTVNRSRDEEWYNHFSIVENLTATAIDDKTVEITSSVPDPKLPTMDAYIVPQHIYEAISTDDLESYEALDGVASGPYRLTDWQSGQSWTMERNPMYYEPDNGIDQVVFRLFSNSDAMVAALQRGEIDAAHGFDSSAVEQLRSDDTIEVVVGQQGGFTELAVNGGAGQIGDGNPALQNIDVRHAIYYAIDRDVLFERVALQLGSVGTTLSPSADTSWIPDLGSENFSYNPDKSNELLDSAGYLDSDGDGVREDPDGNPLVLRYIVRSESSQAAPIAEFVTGWLNDVGIGIETTVMDDSQLYDAQVAGNYDIFVWQWTPFVDPDPMLSYYTCAQVTTNVDEAGANDANWCDPEYDALYEQQKIELNVEARRSIVADMLKYFNTNATYLVLLQDVDLQAYRTDRFAGWTRQPADIGPVLFTNSSPTYDNLRVIDETSPNELPNDTESESTSATIAPGSVSIESLPELSGDQSNTADNSELAQRIGRVVGGAAVILVLVGGAVYLSRRRKGTADDRE